MRHRGQFTHSERFARSRLAKLVHDQPFLCGSLVPLHRVCGKEGCKCNKGELHPGLCVALRAGQKRKMIYVPQALEATARRWVATYQEAWRLMEEVSQACFERFLRGKEKVREQRKAKIGERGSHG
jgi:Family of unknown function (DUF6788)